jgi:hypothetical protein
VSDSDAPESAGTDATVDPDPTRGRRVIWTVYVGVVALSAGFGAMLGVILPAKNSGPQYAALGPIGFEITPVTMAVYGAVMIAVSLGVLLGAVMLVSDRFDDADPASQTPER